MKEGIGEMGMLCKLKLNGKEYVVKTTGSIKSVEVEVQFVSRTNGGAGRLPKNRVVSTSDLEILHDHATAKELYEHGPGDI